MINQIEMWNFRSHEHTVLDLDAHVNVIVGRGQAGKTNVRRAVEWVRYNRPLGSRMMNRFAKDAPCKVAITVTNPDGVYCITAERTHKDGMSYHVVSDMGEEQRFDTPGTKVPDIVISLLNMEEINIHDQLGAPYLVAGSTGEISRAVNRVIQAEEADKWLAELNIRRIRNTTAIKTREGDIKNGNDRLTAFAPLVKVEECLTTVARVERQVAQQERYAQTLDELIHTHRQAATAIDRYNHYYLPASTLVEQAETANAQIVEAEAKATAILAALTARNNAETHEAAYQIHKAKYVDMLTKLGECPTCFSHIGRDVIRTIEEEL